MGWRIVKQPNQLFAIFSEIVDNFTHTNLTKEELFHLCQERNLSSYEANEKIEAAVNNYFPFSRIVGNDGSRWNHCIEIIESVHGSEEANVALKLCSSVKSHSTSQIRL